MFNLAETICRKYEDASFRIAVEELRPCGSNVYTFGGLDYLSDKFANALQSYGINLGDVVGVMLHTSAATVVAHLAALKLGAIIAPFSTELHIDSLERLLKESQAKAFIIEEALFNEFEELFAELQDVAFFIASDYVSRNDFGGQGRGFWHEINFADANFKVAATDDTTPAYVFFELDEKHQLTGKIVPHGSLLSSLQTGKESSAETSLTELFRVLYAGQQITTGNQTGE